MSGEAVPDEDLIAGAVTVVTDRPVEKAAIFEAVYGGFSFAIVIGDEGWHRGEIHYKRRGILSGQTDVSVKEADPVVVETDASLTPEELADLERQVAENVRPLKYTLSKLESV